MPYAASAHANASAPAPLPGRPDAAPAGHPAAAGAGVRSAGAAGGAGGRAGAAAYHLPETAATPAASPPRRALINPTARPWLDIDGERYPLLGPHTVIGRDTTADVILDDPGISRRHSELRVTNDGPHLVTSIRDLGSTNGTFVNGERVTSARLEDGDRLTVGRTAIVFHAGKR